MNSREDPDRRRPAAATLLLTVLLLLAGGCSKLRTDYGSSRGLDGRKSLNGFGALRQAYQQAGFRTRDVSRLSDRVMRTSVIVWTPQTISPIGNDVTGWFERWLRRGNRTLVYVIPDSGSEAEYWIDAGKLASPNQRLEYRKRAAQSINERMLWRLNRGSVQSNGWFRTEVMQQRTELGDGGGSWHAALSTTDSTPADLETEFGIHPYDADDPNPAGSTTTGATGPGVFPWSINEPVSPTKTPVEFVPRLTNESGTTVVAEVTSPRWKDSRIIVVAGGSLLTNYAFTKTANRRLADKIIAASVPSNSTEPLAGFLTSTWSQVPVSARRQGVPKASGMELLTVWPLSIVTIHGVMLGLIICLVLWPIFGRPRRVTIAEQTDFGDHLDAVAALMSRSGGEKYARHRISEYLKRMHHETSGPWIEAEPAKAPIPLTAPRQLSSGATAEPSKPPADAETNATLTPSPRKEES